MSGNLCAYERERLERIQRNRKVMDDLQIAQGWQGFAAAQRAKKQLRKRPKAEKAAPPRTPPTLRQSHRLKGIQLSTPRIRKSPRLKTSGKKSPASAFKTPSTPVKTPVQKKLSEVPKQRLEDLTDKKAEELYKLNVTRVLTMSDAALTKRIQKIKRIDKMESLVQVLKEFPRTRVAEHLKEAKAALKQLRAEHL